MKRQPLRFFLFIIGVMLMLFGKGIFAEEKKDFPVTNIHKALSASDAWLNTSRPITAEELKGRIILLDFWTFCCINCMHVIPDLHYLEEKFGDKLTVIGVHSAKFDNEKDTDNIRSAMLRYGIEHPVINDADFAVWRAFGVRAWPTLVLINPEGRLEEVYSGEGNRDAIEADVAALIKKHDSRLAKAALPISLEKNKAPAGVLAFPGKIDVLQNTDTVDEPLLYISDTGHHRIVTVGISGKSGLVIGSGQAGFKDGSFAEAQFRSPQGIAYDGSRLRLYVADTGNHALRMVDFKTNQVTTLAGTGERGMPFPVTEKLRMPAPKDMALASPWDVLLFPDQNYLVIAMAGTHQLWRYDIKNDQMQLLAGSGRESIDDGALPFNSLSQPSGLARIGDTLYFVDSETSSLRTYKNGELSTLIGTGLFDFGFADGKQGKALMQHAIGVSADEYNDPTGVYITDSYNHAIRRYDTKTGELTTVAGTNQRGNKDGGVKDARFNEPNDIIKAGNKYYVADTNNHAIRVIDMAAGTVSTLRLDLPIPKAKEASVAPEKNLPQLRELKIPPVGTDAVVIRLALPKGWKINEEAPSWMALYEANKDGGFKVAAKFGHEEMQKTSTLKLPKLASGTKYRLQGTFYYCEKTEGSLCLLKSVDAVFSAKAKGGEKEIVIELEPRVP